MFWSISQWILDGTATNHHKPWHGLLQMITWIITDHYKSLQVYHDMNHHKSQQITINHDINYHEPWQKPSQSMTWITTNHHKPWHEPSWWPKRELCIDLIVTFLWTTISRSSLFMNDTSRSNCEWMTLRSNCDLYDLFMNDTI